jgi:hypothetical protein
MKPALDAIKPMAIKSISTTVAQDIVATAQRSNMTTGQLVEKVWAHWKGDGAPLPAGEAPKASIGEVAALMQAAASLKVAGLAVPVGVRSLIAESVRGIRGVQPGRKPGEPVIPGRKQGQLAAPDKAA